MAELNFQVVDLTRPLGVILVEVGNWDLYGQV